MDISELSNLAEIVAAVATVVTLIFVAFELRANRQENRLTMLTTLDQSWNSINAQLAQDKELNGVLARGIYEPDSLNDEEASQFFFLVGQYMNNHKSVWSLLIQEGIDTHHKEWLEYDISVLYATPGGSRMYETMKPTMLPGFIKFVDEQLGRQVRDFPNWRKPIPQTGI